MQNEAAILSHLLLYAGKTPFTKMDITPRWVGTHPSLNQVLKICAQPTNL